MAISRFSYLVSASAHALRVRSRACAVYRNRADLSYPHATLSAVVYNYNNNINIIVISINTFKVRDGRIRVYKKYVYKCVPLQNRAYSSSNARTIIASLFLSRSRSHQLPSRVLAHARAIVLVQAFCHLAVFRPLPFEFSGQAEKHAR